MSRVRAKLRLLSEKLRVVEEEMGLRQPIVIECSDMTASEIDAVRVEYADHKSDVYLINQTHTGLA